MLKWNIMLQYRKMTKEAQGGGVYLQGPAPLLTQNECDLSGL